MPQPDFKYAYLLANLFFLGIWFLLFWRARAFRREMLVMSFIAALFGPISEFWYFKDYWRPGIIMRLPFVGGVEDLLFGFSIGGIGAVIYEVIFIKGFCRCEKEKLKKERFLLWFFIIEAAALMIFTNIFGVNSIYASSLGMIAVAAIMLYLRPDLIINAIGSAILVAGTMFAIYFIGQEIFPEGHLWMERIWKLWGTREGIVIFKHIPWTEMLWGLSWGLVWGPMYEFAAGARTIRLKGRF